MRMKLIKKLSAHLAGAALVATIVSPAGGATISTYEFLLHTPDSLAFAVDSIAGSSGSNRISRYRISTGTMSKMAEDVPPNTNLVPFGNMIWFTTREKPFRIGRADLATLYGNPVYFAPAGITAPFDDMTSGPGNSVWATNSQSGKVVRVASSGAMTTFTGDGSIHPLGIARANDGSMWFADGANRRITRIDPVTGAFTDYPVPQLSAATVPERVAVIASSRLVWFATRDGFGSVDPTNGEVKVVATESQTPRRLAAGADGTLWMTDGTPYVTQFTPPANYAKLRVFAEATSQSAGIYVDASGVVYVSDQWNQLLARIAPAQETPADTVITEFYNGALDHYFVTASPAEAAAIDGGSAGPGWSRTGETWKAWVGGPIPNAAEVCRFYGSTDPDQATGARRGPNSHFYTLQPAECAAVKLDAGWTYEFAGKFWMMKPGAIGCDAWTQPVYRAYNNRFAVNDSNHRYMTSPALYAQMLASGWMGEGVVMCAPN
jgi:streptogramin lyase